MTQQAAKSSTQRSTTPRIIIAGCQIALLSPLEPRHLAIFSLSGYFAAFKIYYDSGTPVARNWGIGEKVSFSKAFGLFWRDGDKACHTNFAMFWK